MEAPSGENEMDVRGTLRFRVRKTPFSFSRSTSPTLPPDVATTTSVLLNGLHDTETMSPEDDAFIGIVFIRPEGRVVSKTTSCFPIPSKRRARE